MIRRVLRSATAPVRRARRLPVLRVVTRLGWQLLGVGVLVWVGAVLLDWTELGVMAASCLGAVVASMAFTVAKSRYAVSLELQPKRVTVGERAAAGVVITNAGSRPHLPGRVEMRVGIARAEFHVPLLGPGREHDELLSIPTHRRAIVPLGPVMSVHGDPIGLCRTEHAWTDVELLYVHPRISPLERLGSGFLKDLEGQTTQDLSNSDVAFHTLREYVPGDDRRHVHWKTTARIGTMMVRQFVDTRRSHLALVVSTDAADYATEDEFELAVSLAASLGVRTLRDDQTVTTIAGARTMPSESSPRLLDACAGIELGGPEGGLQASAMEAGRSASSASIVALVTGSRPTLADIRLASDRLRSGARVVVVRADVAGELGYRPVGSMAMINVPALDEFAQGLWRAAQA